MYRVIRIYRNKVRALCISRIQADAERAYEKERIKIRSGDLIMYADDKQIRATHCGYNRTRW